MAKQEATATATASIHVASEEAIEPFSFRWPDATEEFSGGWQATATVDGTPHTVRFGLGRRKVFGAVRMHAVVFLDGKPAVEGTAEDDYETTNALVSMVKVGRHDVIDKLELPAGYDGMDVVTHRDAVTGPGARRGLAVRLREDDVEGWVRHAVLRLRQRGDMHVRGSRLRGTADAVDDIQRPDHRARPFDAAAVVRMLLDHGTHLEERASGEPPSFTGDPEADRFIVDDPFAFLVAVISDQGIRAERAWRVPFELRRRLGFFDPRGIARVPDEVRNAFKSPPALHRLVNMVPAWIHLAAVKVLEDYGGNAGAIWGDQPTAEELRRRLEAFAGISQKKGAMATEILERDLGVTVRDLDGSDVAYDVHLRRVFLRCGLAERDDVAEMAAAARAARPERPGSLDFPAWDIGRRWCRPRAPRCDECVIAAVCPRLVEAGDSVQGM